MFFTLPLSHPSLPSQCPRRYLSTEIPTRFFGCRVVKPATKLTPKYLPTPRHKRRRYREPWRWGDTAGGRQGPRGRLPSSSSLHFFSRRNARHESLDVRGFVMTEHAILHVSAIFSFLDAPLSENYISPSLSLLLSS